jgi:hypothetical protein
MMTTSELRQNIYGLLDQVIKTGIPLEIKRKGKVLKIVFEQTPDKIKNLKKRDVLNCQPDEIIYNNWEKEWKA